MKDQDFSKRLTIVVRTDLPGWQVGNTIAHIAGYVGNQLGDAFDTGATFVTQDGVELPRNSQYPMIIKGAASSEELQSLLIQARAENLLSIGFIREMIESSNDAAIQELLLTKDHKDLELLGVGVFGPNEQIQVLTQPFKLWK